MLIIALALLSLLTVPLTGGRLSALADVQLRKVWLLPTALGLQVLVISVVPDWPHTLVSTVHVGTYGLAAVFVYANRHVPGVLLIGAGGLCNGVTISLNGGTLPASADALARAGKHMDPSEFANSGVLDDPYLPWLGDQFAIPAGVPLANVFSIGDVLIILGVAYGAHRICRPSRPREQGVEVQHTAGAAAAQGEIDDAVPAGVPSSALTDPVLSADGEEPVRAGG